MSELNVNAIPAINAVDGFNPADFVRNTVGDEGENDLYLDVKYRLLWFRLHRPNGKIEPEIVQLDDKSAVVCCKKSLGSLKEQLKSSANTLVSIILLFHLSNEYFSNPQSGIWAKKGALI